MLRHTEPCSTLRLDCKNKKNLNENTKVIIDATHPIHNCYK